ADLHERLELNRPVKKKDNHYVEIQKQARHNVESHRVSAAGVVFRHDATLIGHQLLFLRVLRTDQFGNHQRHRWNGERDHHKDKDRDVVLRHRLLASHYGMQLPTGSLGKFTIPPPRANVTRSGYWYTLTYAAGWW